MWRAFFLGIGIYMMIFGAQCLTVDKIMLRAREAPQPSAIPLQQPTEGSQKEFTPSPWMPWSMLSGGAVVCLYSFTIPKRMGK